MCESNAEEEGSDEAQQELQPYQPCRLRQSDATAVRRRLTLCIFLYTIGSSLLSQIFPKVFLIAFDGDDGEASKFRGWLAAGVSAIQLIFVPALSGTSDAIGRRAVIAGALILHSSCAFIFAVETGLLVLATTCRLMASLCIVIIPLSQAIMIDISRNGGEAKDATYGLAMAFAAFALATSVGDIVGGSLSEHHRMLAVLLSGMLSLSALLSLMVFGWEETAPEVQRVMEGMQSEQTQSDRVATTADAGPDAGATDSRKRWCAWTENGERGHGSRLEAERRTTRRPKLWRPLTVLKVFLDSKILLRIAFSYFCFVLSLNVFATGYNYFDFRFHWAPLEISYFFATFNTLMAFAGGIGIRFLVPKFLSEERGALFGISVQVAAGALYGLCFRGWMLYPALVFGSLQNITEPCLQAVMATFVEDDRQGSLQGAVMSLRVVGEGVAAPAFTQIFSAGSSEGFAQAPFFLAAVISLLSLLVAWWPLRELDMARKALPPNFGTPIRGTGAPRGGGGGDAIGVLEEGDGNGYSDSASVVTADEISNLIDPEVSKKKTACAYDHPHPLLGGDDGIRDNGSINVAGGDPPATGGRTPGGDTSDGYEISTHESRDGPHAGFREEGTMVMAAGEEGAGDDALTQPLLTTSSASAPAWE